MRLLDFVRSLVRPRRGNGSVAEERAIRPERPAVRPKPAEQRPAHTHPAHTHAGKLQIIGLTAVEAHFGDRWNAVREKAMAIAAKTIRRRLTDVDVFARVNDDSFVVLFIGLDDDHARFKAQTIADEIKALLCGELEGGFGLSVSSRILRLQDLGEMPDLSSVEAFSAWVDRTIRDSAVPPADLPARDRTDFASFDDLDPLAAVRAEFVPTWNVRRQLISSYSCSLVRVDRGGRVAPGSSAYPEGGQGSLTRDLDRLALQAAGEALGDGADGRSPAGIIVPLHFDTMSTIHHRSECQEAIRNLPGAAEQLLAVELCGTPPGTPESRVLEVLGVFKAFCRYVVMRIPFDPRAIAMVPQGPVVAVSTAVGGELSGEALADRMVQFTERAKRHLLNAVLVQERRPEVAAAALRSGFTHISGDVVGPAVKKPIVASRLMPSWQAGTAD